MQDGPFVAMDVETGKIAWQYKAPQPLIGGALATAGNLVFMGEGNGWFDAFNATTGRALWRYNLGAGVNAPPITLPGERRAVRRGRRRRQLPAGLPVRRHASRSSSCPDTCIRGLMRRRSRACACRRYPTDFSRNPSGRSCNRPGISSRAGLEHRPDQEHGLPWHQSSKTSCTRPRRCGARRHSRNTTTHPAAHRPGSEGDTRHTRGPNCLDRFALVGPTPPEIPAAALRAVPRGG